MMHGFCAQTTSKVNVEEEEGTNLRLHIPAPHTFECDCAAVESVPHAGNRCCQWIASIEKVTGSYVREAHRVYDCILGPTRSPWWKEKDCGRLEVMLDSGAEKRAV